LCIPTLADLRSRAHTTKESLLPLVRPSRYLLIGLALYKDCCSSLVGSRAWLGLPKSLGDLLDRLGIGVVLPVVVAWVVLLACVGCKPICGPFVVVIPVSWRALWMWIIWLPVVMVGSLPTTEVCKAQVCSTIARSNRTSYVRRPVEIMKDQLENKLWEQKLSCEQDDISLEGWIFPLARKSTTSCSFFAASWRAWRSACPFTACLGQHPKPHWIADPDFLVLPLLG
jgi:hypothetical protein